uniref:NADH dehydrogenase subunit 3 n=1 Tax=Grandidierella taihuensis TaxID=2778875 RepID=UPI001BEE7352|nr:NADH dehydrogenase subunit 3 [Grandidierella taihuensis]QTX95227.1 NADH dehydrogenase subunit 3 [Grandidierella taihuensis]
MLTIFPMMIISTLISFLMIMLAFVLSEKSKKEREKSTPFECGFSPFKKARSPFSLRFFMITLIFLIFDIELALLLPLGVLTLSSSKITISILGAIVTIILVGGLLHEWNQGALNWVK